MRFNKKLAQKILSGKSDKNIDFNDMRKFILELGLTERIKGIIIFSVKKG